MGENINYTHQSTHGRDATYDWLQKFIIGPNVQKKKSYPKGGP